MPVKKWYMGTNTKMTKTIGETTDFIRRLCVLTGHIDRSGFELFVIPSYTTLEQANRHRDPALLTLGAQNMCWEPRGQFTGEISPLMLREVGCELVMIGHSERRHVFLETDEMACRKVRCALDYGFTVLLCVGETEEHKQAQQTDSVLARQLSLDLARVKPEETGRIWVAYEPVWAIGVQGKPVAPEYAGEKLSFIRKTLKERFGPGGEDIPVFYGGSVNPDNALALAEQPDINGLFVGRSAWDADAFSSLIQKVLAHRETT